MEDTINILIFAIELACSTLNLLLMKKGIIRAFNECGVIISIKNNTFWPIYLVNGIIFITFATSNFF